MVDAAPALPGSWTLTRRSLLATTLLAGAALTVPLARYLLSDGPRAAHELASFVPHVGSKFGVDGGPSLTLVAADAVRPRESGAFSLLFRAEPGASPIAGRIQRLRHPHLGRLDLFVSPVGRGVHGQGYEVIVAQRVPTKKQGSGHGTFYR